MSVAERQSRRTIILRRVRADTWGRVPGLLGESLFRNSTFLFLAGLLNGGFSFIFWVLAAHLYSQSQVGRATALFAAVSLVAGFGTLGFNNSLIRFLPRAANRDKLMNSAYSLVAVAAVAAGAIYLVVAPYVSPTLGFVRSDAGYGILFVLFVGSSALNTVLDNSFTAFRATQYSLLKMVLLNVCELVLLVSFLGLGAYGLFASYGVSFLVVVGFGFAILVRKFGFKPRPGFDGAAIRGVARYSFANYITTYVNSLPAVVLPLLVATLVSTRANAVYFIAYNVAYLLFLLPLGVGNALFAEASHGDPAELRHYVGRAARFTGGIMLPAVLAMVALAPLILTLFGSRYAHQGVSVLRILALSGLCFAVCYPAGAILNVLHRLKALFLVNLAGAACVIGLAYVFIVRDGLEGAAWAWTTGWAIYAAIYAIAAARALSSVRRDRRPR